MSKRKCLSISEKMHLIQEIDKGVKKKELAKKFAITPSSLSTILKKRDLILKRGNDYDVNRMRIKMCTYLGIDETLVKWIMHMREKNLPLSGLLIREKALEIAAGLGHHEFQASEGWLDKFKKRHGIVKCKLAKSSGETSSTITYTVTTSATTTCGTTSSFTTTSLTTVSTTTTFSTTTTPSTLLYTSVYQHQPSTSGIATTSIIKEELDIDPTSFENNLGFEFENTYNNVDQLEAEYCEVRDSKRRRLHNSNDHVASTSHNNEDDDEEDGRDADSREPEESHVISETEEDVESRELSDLLETADTMDLKLNNTLTDNIFNFCNINPTPTRQRDKSSQPHPLRKSLSTAKLKLLDLEQRLRVYHLRSMIRKEEELMNIKIEVNKSQLVKEEMERENKRKAHLIKMENLNLENKLLRLQLQLMVK